MSSSTNILLHPSSYYVGYRAQKRFCAQNQMVPIEVVVTGIDGKWIDKANVDLQVTRKWSEQVEDERGLANWENKEEVTKHKLVSSSDKENPSIFKFESKDKPGNYTFSFSVQDERGRVAKRFFPNIFFFPIFFNLFSFSTLESFYVSGGRNPRKTVNSKTIPLEEVSLIPNKQTYEDGDEGEVLGKKIKKIKKIRKKNE